MDPRLLLNLVYNPVGATLPPNQQELEQDYKAVLETNFGVVFNRLYTITNMPIARSLSQLKREGKRESYERLLEDRFNSEAVENLMCRNTLSVDWLGRVYDCDFNQMLDMHIGGTASKIWDYTPESLVDQFVKVDDHCFGCTAGAGSSCGGELL